MSARRFGEDSGDLAAAYFRWIQPGTAPTIADRAEQILRHHLDLAAQREAGAASIRVYRSGDDSGLGAAVQIVNDDMPLLVESVTGALRELGVIVTEVVHPIFDVARDEAGRLRTIAPAGDGTSVGVPAAGRTQAESWMHVQLGGPLDEATVARIEAALPPLLADLRQVARDTPTMLEALRMVAARLDHVADRIADVEIPEYAKLLRWLADGHFTVLGYSGYRFKRSSPTADFEPARVPGTGLGVLRNGSNVDVGAHVVGSQRPVLLLSSGSLDTLLPGSRDVCFLSVADYADGARSEAEASPVVRSEHVFVGTFTVTGLHENVLDIPLVSGRANRVIEWAGLQQNSFSGQAMLELMQSFPRVELFATDARRLFETVSAVTGLGQRRQVRLFLRHDARDNTVYCLVYLPRDRYSTEIRLRMEQILHAEFAGERVGYSARASESDLAVVYFTVHRRPDAAPVDISERNCERVQGLLFEVTRSWADRLLAEAAADTSVPAALASDYAAAFPANYRQDVEPDRALADLRRLDRLRVDGVDTTLYRRPDAQAGEWRFTLYVAEQGVSLSRVLPVLHSLGVEVVDEQPYQLVLRDGSHRRIYDFELRIPAAARTALDRDLETLAAGAESAVQQWFSQAFAAMWFGQAEIDGLNGLVLRAGLHWRQIAMLRAYAKYLRQAGFAYTFGNITRVLVTHPEIAHTFIELFDTLFDPDTFGPESTLRVVEIETRLRAQIDATVGLDTDRILRAILGLIKATLRTNYFRLDAAGNPLGYLSFKFDPREIAELPRPRPKFEIFVYSPRVEGVHLRFGSVARGGLRWSDRLEDFRTEILGLVKAQAVKNAVIVPVGAKGGFVVKRPPAATGDPVRDRQALGSEGVECYRTFISGLLDVTDNVEHLTGKVVAPERVVRHDGDDTYLVVAADKGTATFSDIANDVAKRYGFWLGDAFASGGSAGYDHKAMGITAKGAWESVKRHFLELGIDTQTSDFTVVGVGDMSGDVFGNGMLLSEHIRLVAAFDHRHIFLDPDPDAAVSFRERERMFTLPRSSWADYDTSLISEGGGVFDKTVKSVPISPEVRRALGLGDEVTALAPPELVRAILLAPVGLLWNGGIGTYIKASTESNAEVGDKSNDSVRVNGDQLRVKVVGEGGNLGATALGRIEFCRNGGKMNTDALDNSAGVDCSDHEVNIKVLLDGVVSSGGLPEAERNPLLASMTDEVSQLVLRDNINQNFGMGMSRAEAAPLVTVHRRLITDLEQRHGLDRGLEALPSDAAMERRTIDGRGLTSPELANLMAHVKLSLKSELLAGDLPDSPAFADVLPAYFPTPLRERFAAEIKRHPLRREIVATTVVNDMVDHGGITYAFRLAEQTGADAADAVRAYTAAVEIFELRDLWQRIRTAPISAAIRDELELETKRTLDRASRWLLANRPQPLAVAAAVTRYRDGIRTLAQTAPSWLPARFAEELTRRAEPSIQRGMPKELAEAAFRLGYLFPLLDVVDIADAAGRDLIEVAELYYALDAHFEIDRLLTAVGTLDRGDRWRTLARLSVRADLYDSLRSLTSDVLVATESRDTVADKIEYWESTNRARIARARTALTEIFAGDGFDLATLSVAARQVRGMISGTEVPNSAA
ncbi:NAD-glutamate dehydrogenase [Nocardia panacis]|uniref:NAD-glutamate dehydrogenase n=1 Tax=Nocardia panacis TaxID=2340916 RepID=A0A3A4L9Y8_9NOCA|nr:NAD-glutamate dehydrogenase [Nocardia panacis]